jgi:tRNA(Phe) wybutosine-synthesizing methylase Tyw3
LEIAVIVEMHVGPQMDNLVKEILQFVVESLTLDVLDIRTVVVVVENHLAVATQNDSVSSLEDIYACVNV